jgi:hypothetical protein
MNDLHVKTYYIGILIIIASNAYLLMSPNNPYNITMNQHAYANLAAVAMIAYYFMTKEGFLEK